MDHSTSTAKNGVQIGAAYVVALERYLEGLRSEGQGLPARNGKVSVSAIALASGVEKQSLYKNPGCRALIENAAQELGLQSIAARESGEAKDGWKDQRILNLEQKVASLQAEVLGLRQNLRRFEAIEAHLVETGRRVIP